MDNNAIFDEVSRLRKAGADDSKIVDFIMFECSPDKRTVQSKNSPYKKLTKHDIISETPVSKRTAASAISDERNPKSLRQSDENEISLVLPNHYLGIAALKERLISPLPKSPLKLTNRFALSDSEDEASPLPERPTKVKPSQEAQDPKSLQSNISKKDSAANFSPEKAEKNKNNNNNPSNHTNKKHPQKEKKSETSTEGNQKDFSKRLNFRHVYIKKSKMDTVEKVKNCIKTIKADISINKIIFYKETDTIKILPYQVKDFDSITNSFFVSKLKQTLGEEVIFEVEKDKKTKVKEYCINKLPTNIPIDDVYLILTMEELDFSNLRRLEKRNGEPNTVMIFSLNDDSNIKELLRDGIIIHGSRKQVREYIDRKKLLTRCYNCNKFGHTTKQCKTSKKCPRCNKENCTGNCDKACWKCTNCGGNHSAAYGGCPAMKKELQAKLDNNKTLSYAQSVTKRQVQYELNNFKENFSINYELIAKIIANVLWDITKVRYNSPAKFTQAVTENVIKTVSFWKF